MTKKQLYAWSLIMLVFFLLCPTVLSAQSATTITAGTWTEGRIVPGTDELWYSFDVTNGSTYYVWWSDFDAISISSRADVMVDATYADGTRIFTRIDEAWNTPRTFTANRSGTVRLRVFPNPSHRGGSFFSITFNTNNTRPVLFRELGEAINSGNISLINARGRNSVLGFSVPGNLRNNTASEILLGVVIPDGIYLRNSNSRNQNMVALQIYEQDGSYYQYERIRYIVLPPNATTQVAFNAFCADHHLGNPQETDSFSIAPMRPEIRTVVSRMSRFLANDFNADLPILLALWRSQGLSRAQISTTFPNFTDSDWETSGRILNY